jgi:hypothetical protein
MFNCIFSSGIVPDSWLLGNIKPIYKNKGDPLNPKHFRPITILSCFGKLFTSILLRDRPFNLKRGGGYGFLFRSEFIFRTTRELEYLFFLSREARIFFPEFNIRLYEKTLNQILSPPPKSEYFF